MRTRHYILNGVMLAALLVYAQSVTAEVLWKDPAAMPNWSGRAPFGAVPALAQVGGVPNGFVDYAVFAPGHYNGSITFNDNLYVYAYQVFNDSTVGIDFFSVGLPPDVQVPNVAYDPAMSYALPDGRNPTMHFKLPESVIYLYLTDNIGAGECSMTLLFTSHNGPEMAYGYVSGGVMGGENVLLPSPSPVPEPATIALLGLGLFFGLGRKRRAGDGTPAKPQ